ncbi:MAG: DUF6089 family protein [Paludibacteraceae bacterium]
MMRKFVIIMFLLLTASGLRCYSQKNNGLIRHSYVGSLIVTGIGPAYCFGDIGGSVSDQFLLGANDWDVQFTRYFFSVGFRQEFKGRFGYRLTYYTGHFEGSDKNSRLAYRDFAFKNNINVITLQGEYTFFGGSFSDIPHSLYFFTGLGIINSTANFQGDKSSRPDDRFKDKVTAPVMPVGIGYQYRISERATVGLEFGWHNAFSDFIDGYSSSTSKRDDTISALTLTFSYKLFEKNAEKCNCDYPH